MKTTRETAMQTTQASVQLRFLSGMKTWQN